MIRFFLGRGGTGKSRAIYDELRAHAERSERCFLLVPEQQAVLCETVVTDKLKASAQQYVEVLNFSRLANRVARTYGGLSYRYVTKGAKKLLMVRALSATAGQLQEFQSTVPEKDAERFLRAVEECKQYGVSPADLEEGAKHTGDSLTRKAGDLSLIYATYEAMLKERYDDPSDDVSHLAKTLEGHDFFAGTHVYVDSFISFTSAQYDVLRHVFHQAESVTIAVDTPDGDAKSIEFEGTNAMVSFLHSIARETGETYKDEPFDKDTRHVSPALSYAAENLWRFEASPCAGDTKGVSLYRARNPFDEVDTVAMMIAEQVRSGAARFADFAVITRDLDGYRTLLDDAFTRYGVRAYLSARTDVTVKPIVKFPLSALRVIADRYRREDVIAYLKTGFCAVEPGDGDLFELYVNRWNLNGKRFTGDPWSMHPRGYVEKWTDEDRAQCETVNRVKDTVLSSLASLDEAFSESRTVPDACRALFAFLTENNVREKIAAEIASVKGTDRTAAMELSQVWRVLTETLDTLATTLPDLTVSADAFLTLLKTVLSEASVGTIPAARDVVTVGDAAALRLPRIRHAFLIGANEGVFPKSAESEDFFTDEEKIALETNGIILSPRRDVRAANELYFFANALGAPSESVTVFYAGSTTTGGKREPSLAVKRLIRLFGENLEKSTAEIPAERRILTPMAGISVFSRLPKGKQKALAEALSGVQMHVPTERSLSNEGQSVSPETANALFGQNISLTQSRIENFVKCPFRFYADDLLKLHDNNRAAFRPSDVGLFIHAILERFLRKLFEEGKRIGDMSRDEITATADEIIMARIGSVVPQNEKSSERVRRLYARLRYHVLNYLYHIADEFRSSKFVPSFFELPIENDGKEAPPPMTFPLDASGKLTVYGTVDRIDLWRQGDDLYVRVIDYKTSDHKVTDEDVSRGENLQLLLYLFTFCQMPDCEFRRKLVPGGGMIHPAGVEYLIVSTTASAVRPSIDVTSDAAKAMEASTYADAFKCNGILLNDPDVLAAQSTNGDERYLVKEGKDSRRSAEEFEALYHEMKETLIRIGKEIQSGNAALCGDASACKYCTNRPFCRKGGNEDE